MSAQQHVLFQWGSHGSNYNGSSNYKGEHNYCHHHHRDRGVWCFPGKQPWSYINYIALVLMLMWELEPRELGLQFPRALWKFCFVFSLLVTCFGFTEQSFPLHIYCHPDSLISRTIKQMVSVHGFRSSLHSVPSPKPQTDTFNGMFND